LFVILLAGLCKKYSTAFLQVWRKGGTRPRKKWLNFGGNSDHVTL